MKLQSRSLPRYNDPNYGLLPGDDAGVACKRSSETEHPPTPFQLSTVCGRVERFAALNSLPTWARVHAVSSGIETPSDSMRIPEMGIWADCFVAHKLET